jgi:hypothetical protein
VSDISSNFESNLIKNDFNFTDHLIKDKILNVENLHAYANTYNVGKGLISTSNKDLMFVMMNNNKQNHQISIIEHQNVESNSFSFESLPNSSTSSTTHTTSSTTSAASSGFDSQNLIMMNESSSFLKSPPPLLPPPFLENKNLLVINHNQNQKFQQLLSDRSHSSTRKSYI